MPLLDAAVSALSNEIDKRHMVVDDRGDQENYFIHYTSVVTPVSMLNNACIGKNASLRLYDSAHFNDPEEGNYLVRSLLEQHPWAKNGNPSHAYIASFIDPYSKDRGDMSNNLIFWRTYGREGEGCSLKLRVPAYRLRRVFYGADKADRTARMLLPILDILRPLACTSENIRESDVVRSVLKEAFWESLGRIRYLYKSEAYKYENECRFVVYKSDVSEDDICFDYSEQGDSHMRVRHYCEHEDLHIERILVSGSLITLGPCVPNRDDLCRSFEILKRRVERRGLEIGGLEIRKSKILYRRS